MWRLEKVHVLFKASLERTVFEAAGGEHEVLLYLSLCFVGEGVHGIWIRMRFLQESLGLLLCPGMRPLLLDLLELIKLR